MIDFLSIGPVTCDRLFHDGVLTTTLAGGSSYYAAVTAQVLGLRTGLVTQILAEDEENLLRDVKNLGVEIFLHHSTHTLTFENHYNSNSLNKRMQKVASRSEAYDEKILPEQKSKIIHLGALLAEEMDENFVKAARKNCEWLSLDGQGWLRVLKDQKVILKKSLVLLNSLRAVDVLKLDETEARILTGEEKIEKAAQVLTGYGAKEILITKGDQGSLIFADGKSEEITACQPERILDTTGCGDTYVAAYVCARLKQNSPSEAANFASRIAATKITHIGALRQNDLKPI